MYRAQQLRLQLLEEVAPHLTGCSRWDCRSGMQAEYIRRMQSHSTDQLDLIQGAIYSYTYEDAQTGHVYFELPEYGAA